MPRTCTICTHPARAEVDQALVAGEAFRDIARRWRVSKDAVARHKAHLSAHIAKAAEAETVARADDLLGQVRYLHGKALGVLDKADKEGDGRLALGAIREATNTLRLLGEVLGQLQQGPQVNVLVLPEWTRVRSAVLETLTAFPEARIAVAGALRRLSDGAA